MKKVNAGWYTETIFSGNDVSEGRTKSELHIDVSYDENRKFWVVSTRSGKSLQPPKNTVLGFEKARTAKQYAKDFAQYLRGGRTRPAVHQSKYVELDHPKKEQRRSVKAVAS